MSAVGIRATETAHIRAQPYLVDSIGVQNCECHHMSRDWLSVKMPIARYALRRNDVHQAAEPDRDSAPSTTEVKPYSAIALDNIAH
eukprot:scaffold89523_cov29-Prasinocladus_malaysianus.AAC.2